MKLLVVDDEASMLNVLRQNIEWERLEFEQVYYVSSKTEAIQCIEEHAIDVLLCDIEMPNGSGLELLKWIRENHLTVCSVIMTCHAEFSFAQQAVQLGSFDYVLKPVRFKQMTDVLLAAQKKAEELRMQDKAQQFWEEGHGRSLQTFWKDLFWGEIYPAEESVKHYLQRYQLDLPLDGRYIPCLFSSRQIQKALVGQEKSILPYALRNIAEELLDLPNSMRQIFSFSDGSLVAVILTENHQSDEWWSFQLTEAVSGVIEKAACYLKIDVNCYVGHCCPLLSVPNQLERLQKMDFNNVLLSQQVLRLDHVVPEEAEYVQNTAFNRWKLLLDANQFDTVRDEICCDLECRIRQHSIIRQTLERFYIDYSFLLMNYCEKKDFFMDAVFSNEQVYAMSSIARSSAQGMIEFVKYTMDILAQFHCETTERYSPVLCVCRLVREHLAEELSVASVAAMAHMNPDYLSRVFKKERGVSLSRYIVECKIETAKQYLRSTDLPIGDIAMRVGYQNYSSFSRNFVKTVGCSPQEYKNGIK